jgi:hypothetical protein
MYSFNEDETHLNLMMLNLLEFLNGWYAFVVLVRYCVLVTCEVCALLL